MDTTLPDLTSMRTLDPMSMRIHTGIIAPIITPIDWEVRHNQRLETDILVHERLIAPQGGDA
jgi:hypothetical protein